MSDWLDHLTDPGAVTVGGAYLAVFAMVFVESGVVIGFLLPGDALLFTAGLLAARTDGLGALAIMTGGVFVAAVGGDLLGYWTGRRFGRPWLLRRAGRAAGRVERAERFYQRWGVTAVVIARFVPWARTFVPLLAGALRMPYARFVAANVAGALIWSVGIVTLGYLAHGDESIRRLAYVVAAVAIAASVVSAIAGPLIAALRRARRGRGRPAREAEPASEQESRS